MDPKFGRYLHVLRDKPPLIVEASPFYGFLFSNVTSFLRNIITSPVKMTVSNVVTSSERGGDKNGAANVNKVQLDIISFFSVSSAINTE
jgi:hypothetical protein